MRATSPPSPTATPTGLWLDTIEQLPSQGSVALQVLWLADDPSTDLQELADTVGGDPALTARLLRLANSAYFSPRTAIGRIDRAVLILGFANVRTLATLAACGLDNASVPAGFWLHSSATATAAQLIAFRFDVDAGEAFTTGLLHDLGRGLFHVIDPVSSAAIDAAVGERRPGQERTTDPSAAGDRLRFERELFGADHAEVTARVLANLRFPDAMVDSIGSSHDADVTDGPVMTRLLVAAEAVAARATEPWGEPVDDAGGIASLDLEPARLGAIVERVRSECGHLAAALS